MKRKLTPQFKAQRIRVWQKLMAEHPNCEHVQRIGEYIIRKYSTPCPSPSTPQVI